MPDEHRLEEPEVPSAPSLTVRLARFLPMLILVGLAIHILLPQWATLKSSIEVIGRMSVLAVAGAAIAQALSYAGSGYMVSSLAACVGNRIAVGRSMMIVLASSSVGLVAGGVVGSAAATYRLARRCGVCGEGALLAGWFPPLFNNAVLLILSLIGLLQLLVLHDLSRPVAIGFGLVALLLGAFAGVILWGIFHRARLAVLAGKISQRWARFRRRAYDAAKTRADVQRVFEAWDLFRRGGWRGPALGAILNSLFDMLTLFLIFVAAGHRVTPGLLLAGYGLPLLIGKFTFLPGGIGVVEGGMAAMYTVLGVPHAVTVVVIIAYRILSFWLPSLVGFPLFGYLLHSRPADPVAGADRTEG
jgi:uncharacterized protein (TIRG00374 family)